MYPMWTQQWSSCYPTEKAVILIIKSAVRAETQMRGAILVTLLLHGALSKSGCKEDLDCSLNGKCSSGTCVCDAAWKGPSCASFNLVPGNRSSGYRVLDDPKLGIYLSSTRKEARELMVEESRGQ